MHKILSAKTWIVNDSLRKAVIFMGAKNEHSRSTARLEGDHDGMFASKKIPACCGISRKAVWLGTAGSATSVPRVCLSSSPPSMRFRIRVFFLSILTSMMPTIYLIQDILFGARKNVFLAMSIFAGFQFADLPVVLLYRLKKRIEAGVRTLIRMWKINRAVSIFLGVVTGALIGYAVWLGGVIFQDVSRSNEGFLATATQQADLTREYQRFYADTTRQLADVTLELNQTTALYADTTRRLADVTLGLNQTTALYQESRKSLQATQQELAVVKSVLSQTESLLAAAQAKNGGAEQQAAAAGSQAVQSSAALINQLKYENRLPRISALTERDRVRLMYGNQGYFVKGGQPVQVDEQQYQATSFDALPPGKVPNPDPKVRVNVTVFQ